MEILVKAAQFFLALSILIILHELGHFLFARLFNTRVEKFYLFFNPWFTLFKVKRGETEFGLGWLPLGGYVKISGMIDESMDKDQLRRDPQPWEFRSKPTWQRLLIMLGGVMVNFVLALVIYASMLYAWGEKYLPAENLTWGIHADSLARDMGLKHGDVIISLDNKPVDQYFQIVPAIVLDNVRTIQVERDGEIAEVAVPGDLVPKLLAGTPFFDIRIPFIVREFSDNSPARDAGIKQGDRITGLNGEHLPFFLEFREQLIANRGNDVVVTVERDGMPLEIPLTVTEEGLMGVMPEGELARFFDLKTTEYTFIEAIPAGISKGLATFSSYLKQLRLIFSPETGAYRSLGGFITIGSIFPGVWDWQAFWSMTAFLSIVLAIMNVLPIPALDGGHVMFLLYEMVSGRKPSEKFMEYAQLTGMLILLSLILYANGNDIVRLFR
ncbi:MAG: RIP metalloprotease RseP [Marinilabiliales bacterium]|nr:MAG: RIP metalloprotease RseP [Marinilabiliales bacterium]